MSDETLDESALGQEPLQITVEISLYPLADDYIPAVKDFIARISAYPAVHITRNDLSTQIAGEYDTVMDLLKVEIRHSWATWGKGALMIKFLQGDLSGLAGD